MAAAPLLDAAQELRPRIVAWRRYLHAHPELSGAEAQTAAYVADRLRELGLAPQSGIGGTHGLYADIAPGDASHRPAVALRADMDALPILEENKFEFASQNPGVMHACGHDAHTAMLLGAAELLVTRRQHLRRPVRLIFQPHEELEPGGAKPMIDAGVLEGVDQIYGLHIWSQLPTGVVSTRPGPMMASPANLAIRVTGMGGHAAAPHECCDPVVVAAEIILALQTVISRGISPAESAVVSVTQLNAGTANNVIPPHVDLVGTIRTFDDGVRATVDRRVRQLANGIAAAHGAAAEITIQHGYPPLINDAACVAHARAAAAAAGFLPEQVIESPLQGGGEDFAFFSRAVPGAFLFLGAGNADCGASFPHHHPRFTIDEAALHRGSALLAQICLSMDEDMAVARSHNASRPETCP